MVKSKCSRRSSKVIKFKWFNLPWYVKFLSSGKRLVKRRCTLKKILCDCSLAIDVIVRKLSPGFQFKVFERLASVEDMLTEMKVNVTLAWIPSHQGIEFNNTAVRMSAEIARTSWQRKWDQDVSGFYTRQLIPKVGVSFLSWKTWHWNIVLLIIIAW